MSYIVDILQKESNIYDRKMLNIYDILEKDRSMNQVKYYRKQKGLSQRALADEIGVARQTINLIEKDKYNPSLNLCIKLANALGTDLNSLFWSGGKIMSEKKLSEENLAFKNKLEKLASKKEVLDNAKLTKLFDQAIDRITDNESVQSVASNLYHELQANFAESDLPSYLIGFQLEIARYAQVASSGMTMGIFKK